MNDDYLWDRTGEPDAQIQELEQVLGTLRYQPKPLAIPPGVAPASARRWFGRLALPMAIAATIAVMLLGLGLWLALQRQRAIELAKSNSKQTSPATTVEARNGAPKAIAPVTPLDNHDENTVTLSQSGERAVLRNAGTHRISHKLLTRNVDRGSRPTLKVSEPAIGEVQEAENAKVQLMLALRVASSKLNFAQKKTQLTNSENTIHNQHKIG